MITIRRGVFFFLVLAAGVNPCRGQSFSTSNLPIVRITAGQPIPDEPKITADMAIIFNGPGKINHVDDPPNHYSGPVGIELRGSTSQFLSPKKPYGFELRNSAGKSVNASLLGMPAESDWVLLAPYFDKSLIRDPLIQVLAGQFMAYAPRMRLVELTLNGEYMGVYILGEKIKRNVARVNIAKLNKTDVAGDALTGGYIIKLDKTTGEEVVDGWVSNYEPAHVFFQHEVPKPADLAPQQREYIRSTVAHFEDVMAGIDYANPATGYPSLIDTDTFIDFMIANELPHNLDAYRLSTFFYKDRDSKDGRLKMGPIWDFNIAFGNANYCGGSNTAGWAMNFNGVCPDHPAHVPFWWDRLLQDSTFRKAASARWDELRKEILSDGHILATVDSLVNELRDAQVRNFQRWPILSTWVWPNSYVGGTYENEIKYLKTWITDRTRWLDKAFADLKKPLYYPAEYREPLLYPNPSGADNPVFQYYVRDTEVVTIKIFNSTGAQVDHLVDSVHLNGWNRFEWTRDTRPGIYFYNIYFNNQFIQAGKLVRN